MLNQNRHNMKKLMLTPVLVFTTTLLMAKTAEDLTGVYTTKKGETTIVWLFVDGYASQTTYKDNSYIATFGGPYTYKDGVLYTQVEYNDADESTIGQTKKTTISVDRDKLVEPSGQSWEKEAAKAQDLDGLWRITGRKQGDNMSTIPRGDRKTIKLLVNGYFQWIAINPAEKGFYGTGGGHYSFKDGKYTEHILFFSRDDARVGANLGFEGELKDGVWHHRGLSSKGDPIYEIWTRDGK